MQTRAYLAGFFDGEGTVCYSRGKDGYYNLIVSVANTQIEALEPFRERWGGNIYSRDRGGNHKVCHTWSLSGKKSLEFLAELGGFLHLKRPQAEEVLRLYEKWGNRKRNVESQEVRAEIYDRLKVLNQRGVQ